jgi:hypothetical protein
MPGSQERRRAKPGMGLGQTRDDDSGMGAHHTTEADGDRPQWLGSLVRRGERQAQQVGAPAFDERAETRWLGSVARRTAAGSPVAAAPPEREQTASEQAAAAWRGSSIRSAVFSAPRVERSAAPVASAPALHELNGHGRMVMGELGMALRVAA